MVNFPDPRQYYQMDRKPKFRSRKLEYNRPLSVYRYDDPLDLDDFDNPMRAVPLVATGVDKEEEEVPD